MHQEVTAAVPDDTGALIDRILTRYHEKHRDDLSSWVPLAEWVEHVHLADPDAPAGRARALADLTREIEHHMTKEEMILAPAMHAVGRAGVAHPISVKRADHDDHAGSIALIRRPTRDPIPPEHASGSSRALCRGAASLLDDLRARIALDNDVTFPRVEPAT